MRERWPKESETWKSIIFDNICWKVLSSTICFWAQVDEKLVFHYFQEAKSVPICTELIFGDKDCAVFVL